MANVVDEFVLKFSLDSSQFTAGQRAFLENIRRTTDDAKKFGDAVESQSKKIFEFFGDLKRAALGVTGLLLGGMGVKEFAGFLSNLDAATARTAKTMDISARELSNWQGAAEQVGGSAEGITATLQGFSSEMNKFALTGQTSLLGPLNQLGVSLYQTNGQLKTSTELFLDITKAVEGMDPAKARAFLSLIGADQGAINLMINGQAALRGYLNAAAAAGGVTEKSAAAAQEYQKQVALLNRSLVELVRTLGIFPGLTEVFKELTGSIERMRAASTSEDWFKGLFGKGGFEWIKKISEWTGGGETGSQIAARAQRNNLESSRTPTRGDRNNNPGNIKMGAIAREFGATGQDEQGHAIFPTWESGNAAQGAVLRRLYFGQTIPQIGSRYAEDPHWAAGVMQYGGYSASEIPNLADAAQMERLQAAIRRQEGTHAPARLNLPALPPLPYGAPGAALQHSSSLYDNRSSSTRSTSIEIGDVHVHAPGAKDAGGIAAEFDTELRRQIAIAGWDTGLA
jgi:hypothetical protein